MQDYEFVALKSKICSLMTVDNREVTKTERSIKMLKAYDIKNLLVLCLIQK